MRISQFCRKNCILNWRFFNPSYGLLVAIHVTVHKVHIIFHCWGKFELKHIRALFNWIQPITGSWPRMARHSCLNLQVPFVYFQVRSLPQIPGPWLALCHSEKVAPILNMPVFTVESPRFSLGSSQTWLATSETFVRWKVKKSTAVKF